MASPETILAQAAADGSFDPANLDLWPKTLQFILDRLEEIYNDFPKPTSAPPDPLSPSPVPNADWSAFNISRTSSNQGVNPSSQESHASQATDKENARPVTPPRQTAPASAGAPSTPQPDPQGIPADIVAEYRYIRKTLSKGFAKEPPHTLQRLTELILEPKRHYRFLPPYLRALDRVVSVTSPSTVFPLPLAVLPGGLLNGNPPTPSASLGSDESLGGALLTPIPWLQNRGSQSELISESTEMVQGPNGAGRIETVSVINGQLTSTPPQQQQQSQAQISSPHPDGETLPSTGPVTQGELLRQEQEAGVLLSNPHSIHHNRSLLGETEGGNVIIQTVEDEDEAPHARGPEMIGMEDTGPQRPTRGTLDIEGAVGRPSIERSSRSPNPPTRSEVDAEMKTEKEAQAEAEREAESKIEPQDQEMKDEEKPQQEQQNQPPQDEKADEEMKEDA